MACSIEELQGIVGLKIFMAIDFNTSRRTYFEKATFWKAKTLNYDLSKLVVESKPSGSFYCKEMRPKDEDNQFIGGVIQFKTTTTQITTADYNIDISVNDCVFFHNKYWRVYYLQYEEIESQRQFSQRPSKVLYITLKSDKQ